MASTGTVLLITSNNELVSHLAQFFGTAEIDAVVIAIEAPAIEPSGHAQRFRHLPVSPASLCSAEYLTNLFRTSGASAIFMDFSIHSNELGLSTAFLMALAEAGFGGHVVYLSTLGDLLSDNAESRALREAWPVKAAVEHQLQNRHAIGAAQTGFSWNVLGPSTVRSAGTSPAERSPANSLSPTNTRDSSTRDRSRAGSSTSLSSLVGPRNERSPGRIPASATGATSRVSTIDIAEAIFQAIEDGGRSWNGKKVMIGAKDAWTDEEIYDQTTSSYGPPSTEKKIHTDIEKKRTIG